MAASFKSFDDGTVVAPASAAAHGDWHVPASAEPAAAAAGAVHDEPAPTGIKGMLKRKKKGAAAAAHEGDGKAGIPGAVFNLANAIIGAGVGGMPYALKEAGFFSGIFLMIMVACCSDYTVRLLITMGKKVNKGYYEQLVQSVFGRPGYNLVCAAMGIFAYGAMVAYLIGIGDNMSLVVAQWGGIDLKADPWVKRVVLTALAIGAVLPLALLKNMAALSKTSLISLLSVVFILGVVILNAVAGTAKDTRLPTKPEDLELRFIDSKFGPAIGVISFAFVCHHACFIVYQTLRDPTDRRWAKTVHLSLGVALTVMLSLSVAAYLTFRGIMMGSFLTNYSSTDSAVNVMRCLFAVTQTLTYPLELFVTRHAIHALFFSNEKRFSDQQHLVITLILWGSSLAIALNVSDLGVVLELTGGVSAVFIGFVLPPLLQFQLGIHNALIWRNPPGKRWAACKEYGLSIYIMFFGITAMLLTVFIIGADVVFGGHGPHDSFADAHTPNGTFVDAITGAVTGHGGSGGSGGHRMLWPN